MLLSELICFCLEVDLTTRDVMNVQGKPNRDRQKLVREQDILKQVQCGVARPEESFSFFAIYLDLLVVKLGPGFGSPFCSHIIP